MSHEVETMFYAGEVPWHGLGVGVEEAQTSEEAIKLAGLDWEVALGSLYGPGYSEVEGKFSVYRKSDNKVLGIASGRYTPLQNAEAFAFIDSLHQDGIIRYETAGSLMGGRKVFLLATMDEDMRVGDDIYKPYLLLTTGHDPWGTNPAVRVLPTTVRVVCNNTLQMALGTKDAGGIRVVHNTMLQERLNQARTVLNITTEASRRLVTWLEKTAEVGITYDQMLEVQEEALKLIESEASTQRQKQIELFQAIYAAEVDRSGDTAYALACAVTGYEDHGRRYMGAPQVKAERRLLATTEGGIAQEKVSALQFIADAIGIEY